MLLLVQVCKFFQVRELFFYFVQFENKTLFLHTLSDCIVTPVTFTEPFTLETFRRSMLQFLQKRQPIRPMACTLYQNPYNFVCVLYFRDEWTVFF